MHNLQFRCLACIALIFISQCLVPEANAQPAQLQETATFYQSNQVQDIHLQVAEKDLARLQAALPDRIYVPATFRWGEHTIANVGVRYKGNSSSGPQQQHKRSFLIRFDEFEDDRTFLGLKRVALDNGVQFGSLFSEQLITSVLRDLGIRASRSNFARLHLNGKYHGVYTNVERIDTVFVRNHFADGGDGALYKIDMGGAGANLALVPPGHATAREGLAFEPKSKSARSDARDVLELIRKINQTSDAEFASVLEAAIDVDAFLKTMAVMLYSGAFDQLTGWNPHNYYLYHDLHGDRWYYLPWDLDVGFADNAFRRIPVISEWNAAWPVPGGPPRPLIERIVDNPQLLKRYRRHADEILEAYFHPDVLLPKVDALYELIKDDLVSDPFPHRRATNPEDRDYESIVRSIRDFGRLRYQTARKQLDTPGARPKIVRNVPRPGQGPEPGRPSPDAPTELRLVAQTGRSLTLQWKDNAKGEVAHIVQRANGKNSEPFRNHIGKPGSDVVTASDTGIAPGRSYRYRVYAIHATPTGPAGTGVSNIITVDVPAE